MEIESFLQAQGIPFERYEHPAVYTCEDSAALRLDMPGADTKNLFLRNKKRTRYFLVTVRHDTAVDLKALAAKLGESTLSFASPEELQTYLQVEPGSVTLLGLVHDTQHAVSVTIDARVWQEDALQCHPLVNTATLVVPRSGMEKFFQVTGHSFHVMEVPSREV